MHTKRSNGFRGLIAWQEARLLCTKIYTITQRFPASERYKLVDQMQRAAGSVKANLAEGSAMATKDHRNAYYTRARGSVKEIDSYIELSFDLHYISQETFDDFVDHCARLSFLIWRLIKA
jgi:four helix bundle protein